jgi:hypothetical protein
MVEPTGVKPVKLVGAGIRHSHRARMNSEVTQRILWIALQGPGGWLGRVPSVCSRLYPCGRLQPQVFSFHSEHAAQEPFAQEYHRAHNLSGFRVVIGLLEDSQPRYAGHEKSSSYISPPRLPPGARSVVA